MPTIFTTPTAIALVYLLKLIVSVHEHRRSWTAAAIHGW